ncbi:MAG: hypothetical protein R6V12_20520, partial [Candidatus Hydrogenedentota bacterium]
LHHGTLLYRIDRSAMARYIWEPKDRPAYRGDRSHETFVSALPLGAQQLREVLREAFEIQSSYVEPLLTELSEMRVLVNKKYRTSSWTFRR